MTDVPEEAKWAGRLIGRKLQAAAVQIAGKPPKQRQEAFARAEQWLREIANSRSPDDERIDDFVNNAMNLVRQFVTQIDVGRGGGT
jgi:hypothetical protein